MGKMKIKRNSKSGVLKDILQDKAKDLRDIIISSEGKVPSKEIENLEHLDQALKIFDSTQPSQKKSKWQSLALLLLICIGISLLALIRQRKTEIELDLSTNLVSFELMDPAQILNDLVFTELGVTGLTEIFISPSKMVDLRPYQRPDNYGDAISIAVSSSKASPGNGTISGLNFPLGTTISIEKANIPNQYVLSFRTPENTGIELNMSVTGIVQVGYSKKQAEIYQYDTPKSIRLKSISNKTKLNITVSGDSSTAIASQIKVRDISFIKKVDVQDISGVMSGNIYLMDLKDQKYDLRTGENLAIEVYVGFIRIIKPLNGSLKVEFSGHVRGMNSGWQQDKRSLMPTWLESIRTNYTIALFWGSLVFLFSLGQSIYKFFFE